VDPSNTQIRFDAIVYNAPSRGVLWQVQDLNGHPGFGTIDTSGRYVAPAKGSLSNGTTEIVVATAVDDPLKKAFARVTLTGRGPEPERSAELKIAPRQARLYYRANEASHHHNEYIDASNKQQLFRVDLWNVAASVIQWYRVDGVPVFLAESAWPWYRYSAPWFGSTGTEVTIRAQVKDNPAVKDEARIILLNYSWPGVV
jgi:hypothetical protein